MTVELLRRDPRFRNEYQLLVNRIDEGLPLTPPQWGDLASWTVILDELQTMLGGRSVDPGQEGGGGVGVWTEGHKIGEAEAFYDDYYPVSISGVVPSTSLATYPAVTAVAISTVARTSPWIIGWIGRLGIPIGTRLSWSALPGPVRFVLKWTGVAEGVDIIFDTGPDDSGLIPVPEWVPNVGVFNVDELLGGVIDFALPGQGSLGAGTEVQIGRETYIVASSWRANGVVFYRFRNGMLGVQNKHGVWKAWRPKKPVVLFAGGATNLRDMIKADRVIDKQAKSLSKVLRRRGYKVAKGG